MKYSGAWTVGSHSPRNSTDYREYAFHVQLVIRSGDGFCLSEFLHIRWRMQDIDFLSDSSSCLRPSSFTYSFRINSPHSFFFSVLWTFISKNCIYIHPLVLNMYLMPSLVALNLFGLPAIASSCPPLSGTFDIDSYHLYPENTDWDSIHCKYYTGYSYFLLIFQPNPPFYMRTRRPLATYY